MKEPVYILGGGRTDFKRNLKKEGKTIRDLITEVGRKAIQDAKIDPAQIEAACRPVARPAPAASTPISRVAAWPM